MGDACLVVRDSVLMEALWWQLCVCVCYFLLACLALANVICVEIQFMLCRQ